MSEAIYECRKYDNDKAQISFMNFMRNKSKPFNKKPNFNQNKPQNFRQNFAPIHYNRGNYNNHFANNQNNPRTNQFPRLPINIQTRLMPPRQFSTNEQVFGPRPQQNYTPTPMSISTRNTSRKNNINTFTNRFAQNSRPNFISEELFNVENNEEEQRFSNSHQTNEKPPENFRIEASEYPESI